jgi:hypothetical protein
VAAGIDDGRLADLDDRRRLSVARRNGPGGAGPALVGFAPSSARPILFACP